MKINVKECYTYLRLKLHLCYKKSLISVCLMANASSFRSITICRYFIHSGLYVYLIFFLNYYVIDKKDCEKNNLPSITPIN